MNINLKRPLLFFDIESTGLNIASDSIAELSFVKIFPDGEQRIKTWRVCPWDYAGRKQKPMDPRASEVNGITDEELAGEPKFYEIVDEVVEWLADADLAGYNSAKFDLPLLAEEIERARVFGGKTVSIDLHDKKMVDVQVIYHKLEPRNLKAAHRFYVGGDFENAHAAEADTLATYAVLKGQLDMYCPDNQIKNDVDWLAGFTEMNKTVDYAGRIALDPKGEPVVNFGKHRGKSCREVYRTEPSYFSWIENGDFTLDTKAQFARLKAEYEAEKKAKANGKPSDESLKGLEDLFNSSYAGKGHQTKLW